MQLKSNPFLIVVLFVVGVLAFLLGYNFFGNSLRFVGDKRYQTNQIKMTQEEQPRLLPSSKSPTVKVVTKYETPALDALTKALIFVMNLKSTEAKVFSQNQEDGVLEAIFKQIGIKHKYYVEFGTESGRECNARIFREKYGWKGLMMDGGYSIPKINLQKEMIFPTNIVQLFEKYSVPKVFDLLSVDTDFKDFWLMQKILAAGYRPRVIVSEINSFMGPRASLTVPLKFGETRGDFSQYFGYSVTAGWHLARAYGYSMVYCETRGVNCFYVIDGIQGFGKGIQISNYYNASSIWEPSCCLPHKPDTKKRPYTTITADTNYS